MNKTWSTAVITRVALAIYVAPHFGKIVHSDRPYHGLVINDEGIVRDYIFSDGRVMRTRGGEVFYLPRGSWYRVQHIAGEGGCYAINFAAELQDEPFVITPRHSASLRALFATATREWRGAYGHLTVMRALYDIILSLLHEESRGYIGGAHRRRLTPILEHIERELSDPSLSVGGLAAEAGVSEVYLRRLFLEQFGVSPKEYILQKRMQYAEQLLGSGQFSVTECALLCGYTEPCHFSREFSRRTGMSPTQFKKGKK